ncbi:hypothetical protein [Alteribacter aurantiacus]|uniref:hypothetical protein n=1 Tax=Alteribacter aurantiacus TaxID=254410 RepID=UPI0004243F25|nr:hypothetical protein [Alteribacter aurantiacus]
MKVIKILTLLIVLSACASSEEETAVDIEGALVSSEGSGVMVLFVEDNVNGTGFVYPDTTSDVKSYEVEAYRVVVDRETKLIYEETGEELAADISQMPYSPLHFFTSYTDRIAVNVREGFEKEVSIGREKSVFQDSSFLPIYHADEIVFKKRELDDIIKRHSPSDYQVDDSHKVLMVLSFWDEVYSYKKMFDTSPLTPYQTEGQFIAHSQHYNDEVGLYDHFIDQFPMHYVIDEDGLVFETGEMDEVIAYLEDDLGFEYDEHFNQMIEDDNGTEQ